MLCMPLCMPVALAQWGCCVYIDDVWLALRSWIRTCCSPADTMLFCRRWICWKAVPGLHCQL